MNINIYLSRRHHLKQKVGNTLTWFMNNYMPRNRWEVNIVFVKTLGGIRGDCVAAPDVHYCEIRVSTEESDDIILTTMIHELIHAKQYMTGRLKDGKSHKNTGYCFWLGKKVSYRLHYRSIQNIKKYMPWERQAYNMSEALYRKYSNG